MRVALKVHKFLYPISDSESEPPREILATVPEGISVEDVVSGLSDEEPALWKILFDDKNHAIRHDILVVLNGCLVNPHDRSDALLGDGDELMFLPAFDVG